MKKFLLYLGLIGLASCSLDTEPTNKYVESSFWKNEAQVRAGLTACYNTLRDYYMYGVHNGIITDVLTPNAVNMTNTAGYVTIVNGSLNPANSKVVNNKWGVCYSGIGRCNTLLAKAPESPVDAKELEQIVAEGKFLRAFYYFEISRFYGDVPLILEAPNIETQSDLPRTPKAEVVKQILKDFEEASTVLPVSYSSSTDLGRPTKGAAYALMSRVCLYNSMWDKAEEYAKKVMDLGVYDLYPDYRNIFARDNENNCEVIFDVQFLNPDYVHNLDICLRQYGTFSPVLELVKAYDMKDGSKYDDSKPLYENRDPRFYATIAYPGGMYMGKKVTNSTFKYTGYGYKKFSVYDAEYAPKYDYNDINFIIMRYADILLSYAEARNERLSEPDQAVYDAINKVRGRKTVEMPPIDPAKSYTKAEMRDIIRHERRIEFAGEGLFYMDILRWKLGKEMMNITVHKHDGTEAQKRFFEEKNYLWPVPELEIMENEALLPNNPGW